MCEGDQALFGKRFGDSLRPALRFLQLALFQLHRIHLTFYIDDQRGRDYGKAQFLEFLFYAFSCVSTDPRLQLRVKSSSQLSRKLLAWQTIKKLHYPFRCPQIHRGRTSNQALIVLHDSLVNVLDGERVSLNSLLLQQSTNRFGNLRRQLHGRNSVINNQNPHLARPHYSFKLTPLLTLTEAWHYLNQPHMLHFSSNNHN
jgi:hypothetical protein